jgi:hypothetical protein
MPMGYSSTQKAALAEPHFRPRVMVQVEGVLAWWNGRRDIPWNSITWRGNVPIREMSPEQGEVDPGSRNMQIVIGALDPAVRAIAAQDHFLTPVHVYRAILNQNQALLGDPVLVYSERVDYMVLTSGENATLSINCENLSILMAQSAPRLRTHQDHQHDHPGDNFYKHTARLIDNPAHVLVGYTPPTSL